MSSSISASDAPAENWRWRRLLRRYAAVTVVLGLLLGGFVLAVDPYDTGRFAVLPAHGVPDFGQRFAFASVGRRPDANTVLLGNSTMQMLDPGRLSGMSGRTVVSLAVPGTGPLEHLALADWFVRHHRGTSDLTLVFGIDLSWCTTDEPITLLHPFPFWLYSRDWLDYALHMMRYKSFEAAGRSLNLLVGGKERAAPVDGYHDYDSGRGAWHFPEFHEPLPPEKPAGAPVVRPEEFSAPRLLREFAASLGPGARVVLVIPPRYASALPKPGSPSAADIEACKTVYRDLAAAAPGRQVVDFLHDDPLVRVQENFWDAVHYRTPVARAMEERLAGALRR